MSLLREDVEQILRVFCASTSTMSLATTDESGLPHAANVNYVADEQLRLYFVSDPSTSHAKHIDRCAAVAATVYSPFSKPQEIRGLQIKGHCQPVDDGSFDRTWRMFCNKFAYAKAFESRARSERFYCLSPSWVRYIDNAVRFGYKWETPWPPIGDVDA